MVTVLVLHRILHYEQWLKVFRKDRAERARQGCASEEILRVVDDPDFAVVITRWMDLDSFVHWRDTHGVKANIEAAGLVGEPVGYFLNTSETYP